MDVDSRSYWVAAVCGVLGVTGLALVAYRMVTYDPPSDGGTSLAGLFFLFATTIGLLTLAEAGVLAGVTRWGTPSRVPRGLLVVGAVTGGLASLASVLSQLPDVAPRGSVVATTVEPATRNLSGAAMLLAIGGLLCFAMGLFAKLVVVASDGE